MMNRHGLVKTSFSSVLYDLNQRAEEMCNDRVSYEEAFARACQTELLNEESLGLARTTLMDNVRRLKGKLDLETLIQTSEEEALGLSPDDCSALLQRYRATRRLTR